MLFGPCAIFLRDLFLHPTACLVYYQNDLSVLIDILLRHMSDIEEDSPVRPHVIFIIHDDVFFF